EDPFGPPARIRCTHSSHRSSRGNTAIGYQRWLLETRPWVPVTGDPRGLSARRPLEAWIDIPRPLSWLGVPRAKVETKAGKRLGLTTADRPSPEALQLALNDLFHEHSVLSEAPGEVVRSALWLQGRLERALGSSGRALVGPTWLVGRSSGLWTWSTS